MLGAVASLRKRPRHLDFLYALEPGGEVGIGYRPHEDGTQQILKADVQGPRLIIIGTEPSTMGQLGSPIIHLPEFLLSDQVDFHRSLYSQQPVNELSC